MLHRLLLLLLLLLFLLRRLSWRRRRESHQVLCLFPLAVHTLVSHVFLDAASARAALVTGQMGLLAMQTGPSGLSPLFRSRRRRWTLLFGRTSQYGVEGHGSRERENE